MILKHVKVQGRFLSQDKRTGGHAKGKKGMAPFLIGLHRPLNINVSCDELKKSVIHLPSVISQSEAEIVEIRGKTQKCRNLMINSWFEKVPDLITRNSIDVFLAAVNKDCVIQVKKGHGSTIKSNYVSKGQIWRHIIQELIYKKLTFI